MLNVYKDAHQSLEISRNYNFVMHFIHVEIHKIIIKFQVCVVLLNH